MMIHFTLFLRIVHSDPTEEIPETEKDIEAEMTHERTVEAPSYSWFFYRLFLAGLLAILVIVTGFTVSCRSFKVVSYNYEDDSSQVVFYGFRGVTDPTTGRCDDWDVQETLNWYRGWIEGRLSWASTMGIISNALVAAAVLFWVVYGLVLRSKRNAKSDPSASSNSNSGFVASAILVGVFLILAGCLIFVTIMGRCRNIPPLSPGGLSCDLHAWSGLALAGSVILCSMGGILACCLNCCGCKCGVSGYLQKELVDDE